MAYTLIINPGSSSKKYALILDGRVVLSMQFERDGQAVELCLEVSGQQHKCDPVTTEEYDNSIRYLLDTALRMKVLTRLQDIARVGVRIVAPGREFTRHQHITPEYVITLRSREAVAPLHIPPTLREIEVIRRELPEAALVAVSDSAFHSTLSPLARRYSIATADVEKYEIERYGYHGLSYTSVVRRMSTLIGNRARVIIAHIGSGVSMTALRDGVSVDTTMGFSPGTGLMMGSRGGDIDTGALLELMRVKNFSIYEAQKYLQKETGLKGLTGEADFRHLLERYAQHDQVATTALEAFAYHFRKALGSYYAVLGGVEAVILTATAAERSPVLRRLLLADLECFGIKLDDDRNDMLIAHDGIISRTDSPVAVALMRTYELDEMIRVVNSFS